MIFDKVPSVIKQNIDKLSWLNCVCVASSPFNAAKSVLVSLFGLNLKVKWTCCGGASGEINTGDLLKAQVNRWLVDVDEAPFQRIKEAWRCLEGAGDALSPRVAEEERGGQKNRQALLDVLTYTQ